MGCPLTGSSLAGGVLVGISDGERHHGFPSRVYRDNEIGHQESAPRPERA